MKPRNFILLFFVLQLCAFHTNASSRPRTDTISKENAVQTFIDAVNGDSPENLENTLDDSFQFSMQQAKERVCLRKKYFADFYKKAGVAKVDCKFKITTISENKFITVIKVDRCYQTYTRSDFLTLKASGKDWKIVFVYDLLVPGDSNMAS